MPDSKLSALTALATITTDDIFYIVDSPGGTPASRSVTGTVMRTFMEGINLSNMTVGTLPVARGGTNSGTALNNSRIMVSSGGAVVEAGAMTNGQLLIGSTGAAPVVATLTAGSGITITNAAGSVTIASTAANHALLSATHTDTTAGTVVRGDLITGQGATPTWTRLALGAAGRHLRSDGTDAAWALVTLTSDVTGTLPIANGGTNSATALNSSRIMVSSGGAIVEAAALTNGQLLIGSTGAAPVAASLTAGTSITITNAAGAITVATTQDLTTAGTPQFTRIGIGAAAGSTTEVTVTQPVRTSGSPTMVTWTGGAHTTLAASTQATDVNFNLARTVQFATGALTTQRAMLVQAPTYAFVGASTITDAATLAVTGAPVAGTNATITNAYALWVQGGMSGFDGLVRLATPTASLSSARFPIGTAPTSPTLGDLYNESGQQALTAFLGATTGTGLRNRLAGTMFTATATATINNTTAETSCFGTGVGTLTLPANYLVAGKTLYIDIHGILSSAAAPGTLTMRLKLGSVNVAVSAAVTLGSSSSNVFFVIHAIITCITTGAGGTVFGQGECWSAVDGLHMTATATATVDTTASQALDVTAQFGTADVGNNLRLTNAVVWVCN